MNGLPRFPAGKRNPMVAGVNRSLFRDELITSLLDTDAYKIHMMQVVFERYPTAWVKYRFHCRSQENLAAYADDVRQAILKLQRLRFSDDQLRYLRTRGEIKPAFVDYLKRFRFDPARHVTVAIDAGQLAIEVEGPWLDTILYEIPVLAIVSEIRNRRRFGEVPEEAIGRTLRHKVERLKTEVQRRGLTEFRFADFGTRRRFSYAIQREVVEYMVNEIPEHFAGTSNYHLAREFQLPAIGTMAHEFIMAHQALVPAQESQRRALDVWSDVYRGQFAVALTDTISSDAFLKDFDARRSQQYQGVRHDSGDPIRWGEKFISHFERLGIDPMERTLTFSDSLTFDRALDIAQHFQGRTQTFFGIGTYLTNDLGDYATEQGVPYTPLSIVMKMVECNGQPVAKISDDPGKSMSIDETYVATLRQHFASA
ncbi:nicotinate phosphoribosyltransferase [Halomonas cupida]|uniref:nicotinate phosphoribosyltransferase n=1 Tax=Halomonas cupida TaxID=44933 RepID=UPI003EF462B6